MFESKINRVNSCKAIVGNKQNEKAISLWTESLERNPNYLFAYVGLTAAYEFTGNHEKVLWAAENVMRVNPKFSLSIEEKTYPEKDDASMKRYYDALRSAGLK